MVVAGLAMNGGGGFGSLVKATTDIEVAGKTNARRRTDVNVTPNVFIIQTT